MALSNPCFEVWLYAHIGDPKRLDIKISKDFKNQIHKDYKGGYNADIFVKMVDFAVKISKKNDSGVNAPLPKLKESKVYSLIESLKL